MKVLVTGASGFLGKHVLACLEQHAIPYIVVGRTQPATIADDCFIAADLLQRPCAYTNEVAAAGATHLLHLAWYAEHGKYWHSPLNLRWVDASVRLAESFCEAGGKHVVVAGTCAEYTWDDALSDPEASSFNPTSLYGVSKDATHRLIAAVCRAKHVRCAWGRVFMPFGAGECGERIIPSLIKVLKDGHALFSIDVEAQRDFLHASDVAEGFITLLQSPAEGAFNISSGKPTSLHTVVKELAHQLNADPSALLELARQRPGEPRLLAGNSETLRTFGWRPRLDLAAGLAKAIITCDEGAV